MNAVKEDGSRRRGAGSDALAVVALCAAALALRAVFLGEVFGSDGTVVLTDPDALYHARRALYSFANFPSVLFFDPYLNHPDGSPVPWPPLYDWTLAAAARALGGSPRAFDLTLAWAAPVLGALTVVPVYAIGRALAGRGTAAAAAALFAALPVGVHYARVGNPDHHACSALLGACFLALSVAALRPASRGRALVRLGSGLFLVRVLLVLSWSGSLLYLGLGEGALLLGATLAGRRDLLLAQAAGTLGAAAAVAPWVWAGGSPAGGPFSTFTLSWFHVAALAGAGAVCGGLAELERRRPARALAVRAARAIAFAALAAGVLLAFPAPRRALAPSVAFLTKTDTWGGEHNPESRALFGPPIAGAQVPRRPPTSFYGWFAYALPLAMAVALLRVRRREEREAAACFALWTVALGVLAIHEIRFGPDFAPAASVALALSFAEAHRPLARRLPGGARPAAALAILVGAAALWPPAADLYWRQLVRSLSLRSGRPSLEPRTSWSPFAALLEFGERVRRATPETAGYLDAGAVPEYGVLVEPTIGHAIRWASRRAVPADNFGPYLDAERFALAYAFFATRSEREAVEIATRLRTRYVVTAVHAALRRYPAPVQRRLHADDGSARRGSRHLERFRLVTEGPAGGRPFFPVEEPRSVPPYKLFEVVEGAVLEVRAAPRAVVRAELDVETPIGRRFRYRAVARADAGGLARLRVPYATEAGPPTRANGPWRVRVADTELAVEVSERDVLEGGVVRVN
jgi:asparagine N-glycosylation enzyme membrane subunit Stt3